MRIKALALTACLLMPFQMTTANIADDFAAGMSLDVVMVRAIGEGMSIENAVAGMVALHPEIVELIIKDAVKLSPEKAGNIVAAAIVAAPKFKNAIISAAIAAGANSDIVNAAVAAGVTSDTLNTETIELAKAKIEAILSPASGSGGGIASPN